MSSYYSISSEDRSWVYRNLSNHMADHSPRCFNEDSDRKMILSFSFELKQKKLLHDHFFYLHFILSQLTVKKIKFSSTNTLKILVIAGWKT